MRHLRSGHDFVGSAGKTEGYAAFLVRLEGRRQVELGKGNLLRPISVGPVFTAGVDYARDDGIVARFFAMAVAENERRGRSLGGSRSGGAGVLLRRLELGFCYGVGLGAAWTGTVQ